MRREDPAGHGMQVPGDGERQVQTARGEKHWRSWQQKRLEAWAAVGRDGFDKGHGARHARQSQVDLTAEQRPGQLCKKGGCQPGQNSATIRSLRVHNAPKALTIPHQRTPKKSPVIPDRASHRWAGELAQ